MATDSSADKAGQLNNWIFKLCPGGRTLALLHSQGMSADLVVCSWGKDEIDAASNTGLNIGGDVLMYAQEHADNVEEACKFLLQWQSESGKPIRATVVRAAPEKPTGNTFAENADLVSGNATLAQLLTHIATQQRTLNSVTSVLANSYTNCSLAYERVLKMQAEMLDRFSAKLDMLPAALAASTAEDEDMKALKMRALERLIERGPAFLEKSLELAAKWGVAGDEDPEDDHTNGASAA